MSKKKYPQMRLKGYGLIEVYRRPKASDVPKVIRIGAKRFKPDMKAFNELWIIEHATPKGRRKAIRKIRAIEKKQTIRLMKLKVK